jgi:hypothetical protein
MPVLVLISQPGTAWAGADRDIIAATAARPATALNPTRANTTNLLQTPRNVDKTAIIHRGG